MKSSCPTAAELEALLRGALGQPAGLEIEEHLKTCAPCRQRLNAGAGKLALGFDASSTRFVSPPAPVREVMRVAKAEGSSCGRSPLRQATSAEETRPRSLGNYEILGELGRGGMGVVYRARQAGLQREVALKVILAGQLASGPEVRRFRVEAEAAARLDHPRIVPIYEIGERDGHHFFSMKLVEGRHLAQAIAAGYGRPDSAYSAWRNERECGAAARLMMEVARAVHYAHERGVLHRDLKPSNILLDGDAQPYVTDFGLAKLIERDIGLTQSMAAMGTPNYMAPEQAAGKSRDVTTAADVFSLGAMLYEMVTGVPPFQAETPLAILERVVHAEPATPARLNPAVPRDLATITLKCLEKDPARRYASAALLAEELERFTRGEPIRSRPVSTTERAWRWCKRQPALAASLLALQLSLVAGLAAILWQWRRAEAHARAEAEERGRAQAFAASEARQRTAAESARLRAEMERIEMLFGQGRADLPLAHLARLLRRHPTDRVLATRLTSTVGQRNFCLPSAPPLSHPDEIRSAQFSPDGKRVLTVCSDGFARLWDASSGQLLSRVPHLRVNQAGFSPDGKWFVTSSADRTARLWAAQTGQPHPQGQVEHDDAVLGAAFRADGQRLITCSQDGTARVWDMASLGSALLIVRQENAIVFAGFSPDGKLLVTRTAPGRIQVWDAATGEARGGALSDPGGVRSVPFGPDGEQPLLANAILRGLPSSRAELQPLIRRAQQALSVAFSPDGRSLLTGQEDRMACLWDLGEGKAAERIRSFPHDGEVEHAAFSSDGRKVATASRDNTARVWDALTGDPLTEPIRHDGRVTYVQFSPDARRLLTVRNGTSAWLWDVRVLQPLAAVLEHGGAVRCLAFGRKGDAILTASEDGKARIWDAATGRLRGPPLEHRAPVVSAVFSPDEAVVATAAADGVWAWDAGTGKFLARLPHRGNVRTVEFSPDGRHMVSAAGAARVWNVAGPGDIQPWFPLIHNADNPVEAAHYSGDGRRIVTVCGEFAWVWDATRPAPPLFRLEHDLKVVNAVFTRDGRNVVTVSADGTARVWDAETGRPLLAPVRHPGPVQITSPDLHPDGRRVVTSALQTIQIWDLRTGQNVVEPLTHQALVRCVRFSPDGQYVASGSDDRTCVLWDVGEGLIVHEPFRHAGPVLRVEFSPDGRWLLTGSEGGIAGLCEVPDWRADTPAWLPELAEAMGGLKLNERDLAEAVAPRVLLGLKDQLTSLPATNACLAWVRWLFADSAARPISPHSALSVADYVERRLRSQTLAGLREAVALSPTNGPAYAQLGLRLLATEAASQRAVFVEADNCRRWAEHLAPGDPQVLALREACAARQRKARSDAAGLAHP